MNTKIKISPTKNTSTLDTLLEAINESGIKIVRGKNNEIVVDSSKEQIVEKMLKIHGFDTSSSKQTLLNSAVVELATKIEEKGPAQVDKKKLAGFIRRKIKNLQTNLKRRRTQHVRDEITGQIRSLEDTLRKLKNM